MSTRLYLHPVKLLGCKNFVNLIKEFFVQINNRFFQIIFIFFTLCSNASAFTWNQVSKVTIVEATYMPRVVSFQLATMPAECASSTGWLLWYGKGSNDNEKFSNAKSTFVALMAAQASGNSIHIYGSGCQVEYLHLLGS
jgi:hypothetical protein